MNRRYIAGILMMPSPSGTHLLPFHMILCSYQFPLRSSLGPYPSQLLPYRSQIVPCQSTGINCSLPPMYSSMEDKIIDLDESALSNYKVFLQYKNGRINVCCLIEQGTLAFPSYEIQVQQYTFMSFHLHTGIVQHTSGKFYTFIGASLLQQKELYDISDRSLCPNTWSSTNAPSILSACAYSTEPMGMDREPINILDELYDSNSIRFTHQLVHRPLVSLPELSSQQKTTNSEMESNKQQNTTRADKLDLGQNQPRPISPPLPSDTLRPPAKVSKGSMKTRNSIINQMVGFCPILTKKKRRNSINYKKGFMGSFRHQSHCSVFRGENQLFTSSDSEDSNTSSSSDEHSDEEEEVRRKPLPKPPPVQHGHLSSYTDTAEGENDFRPKVHSPKLTPNNTKSNPACGLVDRRLQPRSSLLQSAEILHQEVDTGAAPYPDRPEAFDENILLSPQSDSPSPPQSFSFSHDSLSDSFSSDNALGTFNELVEPDYMHGIPRLELAEDYQVSDNSELEGLSIQEPIQESLTQTQAQGEAEQIIVTPRSLPPGLHLLFQNSYIVPGAVPPQPHQIEASNAGVNDERVHDVLVEPENEELVKLEEP